MWITRPLLHILSTLFLKEKLNNLRSLFNIIPQKVAKNDIVNYDFGNLHALHPILVSPDHPKSDFIRLENFH